MPTKAKHSMLEVDLASNMCRVRPLAQKVVEDYIGGLGLGMKILYDEVGPGNPG